MRDGEGGVRQKSSWLDLVADPVRLEILRVLSQMPEATASDLARHGRSSEPTLRRHLDALVSVGLVTQRRRETDGTTPGRPPSHFSLSSKVRDNVRLVFGIAA